VAESALTQEHLAEIDRVADIDDSDAGRSAQIVNLRRLSGRA
jgi:hypothetical protein